MNQRVIKLAFLKSLPVLAGYVVLGTGFGILLRTAGYGILWAFFMSLLIYVYCLKDVSLFEAPFGLPELIAGAGTACLQIWRRNSLVSILGGTVIYMILIQVVF